AGVAPDNVGGEAIAALDAAAVRLRVEARGEVVAGKRETVGGHPMVGVGQGRGEIGRTPLRRAVDAGLERVALAAADPLREGPIGAAAGEREAHHRAGRETIIKPRRAARRARGKVMAADHPHVAGGAIPAALPRTPHAPALPHPNPPPLAGEGREGAGALSTLE